MIKSYNIKSFGPIATVSCAKAGKINLVIGPNGTGKTILLKTLYSAIKTTELFGRGKDTKKDSDILFDKLYWTFQIDQLGKMVRIGDKTAEFLMVKAEGQEFAYSFGTSTERQVRIRTNTCEKTMVDSVFIPAKEVLSLLNVVIRSHDTYKEFGFDETYYDLAKALQIHTIQGKNHKEYSQSREILENALGGKLIYDKDDKEWYFKQGNRTIPIASTSEGIKKMSVLDTLLGNHYLKKGAVVFIDEPEAALHPSIISTYMEIIQILADAGLQFFISTHSYFVIKKLYILAHKMGMSIPVVSFNPDGSVLYSDLHEEMPDNAIIEESIKLYREEIDL